MKLLFRILLLAAVAVTVVFAIFNRDPVTVDFWPFPFQPEIRLYLVLLATLLIGLLIGSAITWSTQGRWRRRARQRSRRMQALEREISALGAHGSDIRAGEGTEGTAEAAPSPQVRPGGTGQP